MRGAHPLRPGDPERVGDYEVLGFIGEGGQGTVLLGRNRAGQRVAIKLLRAEFSQNDDARKRFLREAELMQRVAPFCTIRVLDAGVTDRSPYIVSEYVEGESLEELVRRDGPRTGSGLSRLAVATLTALSAIHRAGIVHQDFKPSNVLMGPEGPVVIDFGIARVLDTTGTVSQVVGTPSFMSPEQVEGKGISPASDLFSWAATMVYAATGRLAFSGNTIPAILHNVITAEPDLTGVPQPLSIFVGDCLAKNPRRRPTAKNVLSALTGEIPVLPRDPSGRAPAAPAPTKILHTGVGAPPGPGVTRHPAGPAPAPVPGTAGPGFRPGPTPPPGPPPGPTPPPGPPPGHTPGVGQTPLPSGQPSFPPPGPRGPVPGPVPGPVGAPVPGPAAVGPVPHGVPRPGPVPVGWQQTQRSAPGTERAGWPRALLFALIGFCAVLVVAGVSIWFLRAADRPTRSDPRPAIGAHPLDTTIVKNDRWDVRFVRMQVTANSLILTVRYQNLLSTPQYLVCGDAIGGTYLRFADGERVVPTRTPCSSRIGRRWEVGGGRTFTGTATFPVRGHADETFTVNWFNWGTSHSITIPSK